jgi:hypothetical protein
MLRRPFRRRTGLRIIEATFRSTEPKAATHAIPPRRLLQAADAVGKIANAFEQHLND